MGSSGYEREKVGSEVWGFSKDETKGKARAIEKVIERQERGWGICFSHLRSSESREAVRLPSPAQT